MLHSPHTPEIDALLEKMMNGGLTGTEAEKLKCLLYPEMETEEKPGKKLAYMLAINRLEQIQIEKEAVHRIGGKRRCTNG